MEPMKKFTTWIILIAAPVMLGSGTPPAPDEEDDEGEKDKAVSGLAQSFGWGLLAGSTGMLFITPETAHGQHHDRGSSTWFFHDFSLAATFLAMGLACVLLFYALAKPGPSRRATRAKIRIAGIGLFWFVLGGVSRISLSLPPSYWNPVIGLTFAGLIISAIYILYPWLCGSTGTSAHEKSKPSTTEQYCCPLQHLNAQDRLLRVEVAGENVVYVISSEVNQHEEDCGKTTTGGTNITQSGMPIQGSCGVPSQFEDIGDHLSQSNQGNQQLSMKGNQAREEARTVRPHQAPMERTKGSKEEPNQMMEMMNLYDKGSEINPHKWPFVASSQRDCITPKYPNVNDGQSSRVINGTKRTQKSTPIHGSSDVPYPLGVFGDPLVLLNQTDQQFSSRKGKQDKEIDKTVKPCKAPVERDEGIKEEPMRKVINLLDKLPEITGNYDEWRFAVYLLHDCITQGLSIENEDPSHIANWIKLKYTMNNNQLLKVAFAGNEEARGELSSMMRMPMPI